MPDIENPPWTATPGDTWTAQSTGRTYRFAVVELERIEPDMVEWGRRTPPQWLTLPPLLHEPVLPGGLYRIHDGNYRIHLRRAGRAREIEAWIGAR